MCYYYMLEKAYHKSLNYYWGPVFILNGNLLSEVWQENETTQIFHYFWYKIFFFLSTNNIIFRKSILSHL